MPIKTLQFRIKICKQHSKFMMTIFKRELYPMNSMDTKCQQTYFYYLFIIFITDFLLVFYIPSMSVNQIAVWRFDWLPAK